MPKIINFVLLLLLIQSTIFAQTSAEQNSSKLNAYLQENIKPYEPGIAVLVVQNGKVLFKNSYGLADISTKTKFQADTPFYIASVGKQFTAVAVMMLEERGLLSYEDKLIKYFPEFKTFAPEITIRQILTHTSGLIDHLEIMQDEVRGWTNQDVVELLKKENRVIAGPGEKWSYSNSGYVLLALIVEKIIKKSFSRFLDENIFETLEMKNTSVADKTASQIKNKAVGYQNIDGKWQVFDYDAYTTGAGGIYSTLEDLHKWDQSFYTEKLLKKETVKLASTPATLNNGKPTPFGFGWLAEFAAKGDLANIWYVVSTGDFKGNKSFIKRIPEKDFTLIVLSNSGDFHWDVIEMAHELYLQ